MAHWAQCTYTVINRAKYVGNGEPRSRSGWELSFMRFLDSNDSVLQWASESVAIPYRHPLTGKMTRYIPDFLMTYRTRDNQMRAELIEIKPKKLIMFCNFNKQDNLSIFNIYNKSILDNTNIFRNNFIKNKSFYTFNNLSIDTYNKIIEDYNTIVYNTIYENLNLINVELLYNSLLNNNINKIINSNKLTFNISKNNNELVFTFNDNIIMNLSLFINKNKITNNLPVFYKINLINKF